MALHIYPDTISVAFSEEGNMSNAIRHAFDGSVGGIEEVRYYLRNDDNDKDYTEITITPIDFTGASIVDGTDGFSIKLRVGNSQPTRIQWDAIEAGAGIDMDDISDIATYLPFWVRVEIPRGADIGSFEDVVFRIEATEDP